MQLFRTLYKNHGGHLDTLEMDLLIDTILKILLINFEAYCKDKNIVRDALIVEILGKFIYIYI